MARTLTPTDLAAQLTDLADALDSAHGIVGGVDADAVQEVAYELRDLVRDLEALTRNRRAHQVAALDGGWQ